MIIKTEFEIGDEVYLKTDPEQIKRLVTGITVRQTGTIYELVYETFNSWHYNFEISNKCDIVLKTSS